MHESVVLDDDGTALMRTAMGQMDLSGRVFHRVLKLARTIADLDNTEHVGVMHLAEALQYRPRATPAQGLVAGSQ